MRTCQNCSLCCRLLEIPALDKPAGTWCTHCAPGKGGCTIYEQRPSVCHKFACQWLKDESFGEAWFPPRAKMFCYLDASVEPHLFRVVVDRNAPRRWREKTYIDRLRLISYLGLDRNTFHTVANYRDESWLILPNGADVDVTDRAYVVSQEPDVGWQVKLFKTLAEAEAWHRGHLARR